MFRKSPFIQRVLLCSATYFVIFLLIKYLDEKRLPAGDEWWKPVIGSIVGGLLISIFDRPSAPWNRKKSAAANDTPPSK
jgi:hypothetical protein